jgi:hypothetical protein
LSNTPRLYDVYDLWNFVGAVTGFVSDGFFTFVQGLKNIYNRAKMVGATVQLSTAPEKGFEMRFSMPETV